MVMKYYMYSLIVGLIVHKQSVTYAVSSVIDTTYCDKPWQEIQKGIKSGKVVSFWTTENFQKTHKTDCSSIKIDT